jgi:addiction module HigA family antidote
MARVRTHPGEVLREEYLAPLGLSAHQLAEAIDVPANRISEIVRENRSVTADTALRLAKHFNTTPEFWLNLQTAHDLSKAIAEAPTRRYVAVRDDSRSVGATKPHGEGRPVTGSWIKRDAMSGKITKHEAEISGRALSQRSGAVKNKPIGKSDRHPTKRK